MRNILFKAATATVFGALMAEMMWIGSIPVDAATHSRTFRATAYCGCRRCNGKWYGCPTASGTEYVQGRTVAVDKHQIKLGTHITINGVEYIAEDTGSDIGWDCVDVFFDSHSEAQDFGVRRVTVEWED